MVRRIYLIKFLLFFFSCSLHLTLLLLLKCYLYLFESLRAINEKKVHARPSLYMHSTCLF